MIFLVFLRAPACKILTQYTATLPLDFFDGFFAFFALVDFGVFFCTFFGVFFTGVAGFFFFLGGGYYIQQIPRTTIHTFVIKILENVSIYVDAFATTYQDEPRCDLTCDLQHLTRSSMGATG